MESKSSGFFLILSCVKTGKMVHFAEVILQELNWSSSVPTVRWEGVDFEGYEGKQVENDCLV